MVNVYYIGNVVGEVILIREWFSFGRVIEMDKEGCTVKWRNRSKGYRWSELKTRRIENNIKSCYTDCRKCAVISPYEIKRFRKKELFYKYFTLERLEYFLCIFR